MNRPKFLFLTFCTSNLFAVHSSWSSLWIFSPCFDPSPCSLLVAMPTLSKAKAAIVNIGIRVHNKMAPAWPQFVYLPPRSTRMLRNCRYWIIYQSVCIGILPTHGNHQTFFLHSLGCKSGESLRKSETAEGAILWSEPISSLSTSDDTTWPNNITSS